MLLLLLLHLLLLLSQHRRQCRLSDVCLVGDCVGAVCLVLVDRSPRIHHFLCPTLIKLGLQLPRQLHSRLLELRLIIVLIKLLSHLSLLILVILTPHLTILIIICIRVIIFVI